MHEDPAGPVALRAGGLCQRVGDRGGFDSGGPQHGASVVPLLTAVLIADNDPVPVDAGRSRAHVQLHAQRPQFAGRSAGQFTAECGQRSGAATEQQDPGVLRLHPAVFTAQSFGGQLADLASELDAGRSRADKGEGEPAALFGRVVDALAISNAPYTCRLIVSASESVFMPGAHAANSSWPKYDCRVPAATIRWSYGTSNRFPSGRTHIRCRATASTSIASAVKHSRSRRFLNSRRSGALICPADKIPVAHW